MAAKIVELKSQIESLML